MTKLQHKKAAFQYLLNKIQNGKKANIKYTHNLKRLIIYNQILFEDKRQKFAIRSETDDLPIFLLNPKSAVE